MRLLPNWRKIALQAWSSRLMVLAIILTIAEVALPLLDGYLDVPQKLFAILAGLATAAAWIARLYAQKGITRE